TATSTDTEETFAPFGPADYLNTVEDVAAYLEAVIDENDEDPTVIARALGAIARSRNISQNARQAKMSRAGLDKALFPDGTPSLATVLNVSHALGIRIHVETSA